MLNSHALRVLASALETDPSCDKEGTTGMEDVFMARCLKSHGIGTVDTRDDLGRERFHPFGPGAPPAPSSPAFQPR